MTSSPTPTTAKLKLKADNPIAAAIKSSFEHLPPAIYQNAQTTIHEIIARAPKRWVVYFPLVLLPAGSFDEKWWEYVGQIEQKHKDDFWRRILYEIGKREGKGILTHLAVNAGIPMNKSVEGQDKEENILRTPSGLVMLYGDFGPALNPERKPSEQDLEAAFWVSTKQNGITQIWAPRYTMFSRGNVKEKSRLLDFHGQNSIFESRKKSKEKLKTEQAVDLYAGIGYFVFSYVKLGLGKVFGWELNPWSVEGLRRGAVANGWSIKVLRPEDDFELHHEQIVVMLEDNRRALARLSSLPFRSLNISHINCGMLPSSESCWEMALRIMQDDGWLHLHENVGVKDIKVRTRAIEDTMRQALRLDEDERDARAEHVELVKTFAPGVWHCVFDVYIGGDQY